MLHVKNKANHKVNKKIGFRKEGLFKEYLYKIILIAGGFLLF